MTVFYIILTVIFAILTFFNIDTPISIEPERKEQYLNAANGIVSFLSVCSVLIFLNDAKYLAACIIFYMITRFHRHMRLLSKYMTHTEKLEENLSISEKWHKKELEKANKEIEFQKQVANEYREANRELHRKLYAKESDTEN